MFAQSSGGALGRTGAPQHSNLGQSDGNIEYLIF